MKLMRPALLVLAALGTAAQTADPVATPEPIRIDAADGGGEVEFDTSTGAASARNGVVIRHRGTVLQARTITLGGDGSEAQADGDVRVESQHKGKVEIWRGEHVRYDFQAGRLQSEAFRLGMRPLFIAGESASGSRTNGTYSVQRGFVTSDDLAEPGYRITAKELVVVPGKSIEAREAKLVVGGVPLFYWPVYHRSLERHPSFWTVTPGYRSVFGPFSLNEYHWNVRTNVEVTLNLDWRLKRGVAGGPGLEYDLGKWGQGGGRLYLAHDDDPYSTAQGIPVRDDRRVVDFHHSYTNGLGLTLKGRVAEQNDALVRRDFFEGLYRRDPQPRTFFELNQQWPNWSFDVTAQPQLNSFFQTIERLPDLKLTGLRQQIGDSGLFYEGESSFAYLRFRPGLLGGTNYSGTRGDTYHQVVLPKTYFGWLNVTPRVGGRFTYYGDPEGLDTVNREQYRGVFNTGMEVGTKASRLWAGANSRALEVDGLRHIVEPSVNYVYVPQPGVRPPNLPQYDFEFTTPRLLPVEFTDYNAIDSIDSQNVVRWALRNRLQTKREGRVEDLLNWALYTDWRLRPNANQTTFPDLYSDMDFAPRSWLLFTSQVRYDINRRTWDEANHRVTIEPGDRWAWSLGHRYLRDDLTSYGVGNNLVYSSVFYRFNENWGLRATHQFEARDGVLEEQHYSLYRDLRSWTVALGLRLRDNRTGPDDWSIVLTFQLKAYPRFKLNQDRDIPERLFGG